MCSYFYWPLYAIEEGIKNCKFICNRLTKYFLYSHYSVRRNAIYATGTVSPLYAIKMHRIGTRLHLAPVFFQTLNYYVRWNAALCNSRTVSVIRLPCAGVGKHG